MVICSHCNWLLNFFFLDYWFFLLPLKNSSFFFPAPNRFTVRSSKWRRRMQRIAWSCALISVLRWKGTVFMLHERTPFEKIFFGHLQFDKVVLVLLIILRVLSMMQWVLCLSPQARSWHDFKSWLSPLSYCMLHFLAAFWNGFHLSVLLVLLVDHCKPLSSVW